MMLPRRNFSMGDYLIHKCDHLRPRHAFAGATAEEWSAWRDGLRAALHELLSPWPQSVPLQAVEEEPFEEEGYWRQRVVFDSEADMSVPAWLLTPKKALAMPCPALLAVHGHGNGKDDAVGLNHAECIRVNALRNQGYGYAAEFTRRGYVVLAPDFQAWGERELGFKMTHAEPCDYVFLKAILLGITLLTLQIWDGQRSLDYLCSGPDVDPTRLGCLGLSFGGNLTMWLSALDERESSGNVLLFQHLSRPRHRRLDLRKRNRARPDAGVRDGRTGRPERPPRHTRAERRTRRHPLSHRHHARALPPSPTHL